MIHHKHLNTDELKTFDDSFSYRKYILIFDKKTTNYFESKCRYYFNLKPIVFEGYDGGKINFNDIDILVQYDLVQFEITYNRTTDKFGNISLFVKNKGTKGKKFYQFST